MDILITGATGFIGKNLIRTLIKSGHSITACIHKTELAVDIKVYQCDFAKMLKVTDWLPCLVGIDVVINCVGIISESYKQKFETMHHLAPLALFKACEKAHVKRVIQVSALGADDTAIVDYHKSKKLADDYLRSSSLQWFVLRPSLIYGEGGKSHKLFTYLSRLPVIVLIGNGKQLIQPVAINTMIDIIIKCIVSSDSNLTIDVVGQQAITYRQWMVQLRNKKTKARFIKLPISLAKFVAKLLKPFKLNLLTEDNLTLLAQNNTADYEPLKNFMEKNK